jgi:hypothetical protein
MRRFGGADKMVSVQITLTTTAYQASQPKSLFGFAFGGGAARLGSLRGESLRLGGHTGKCSTITLDDGYLALERHTNGILLAERNQNPRIWTNTVDLMNAEASYDAAFDGSPVQGNGVRCWSHGRKRTPN